MGVDLALGSRAVAVLEQVGEPPSSGRHGDLEVVRVERQLQALRRVGESLVEVVGAPLGVAPAVDRHRHRRAIPQTAGHRHGLLAELEAPPVEVGPVHADGQAGEQPSAHLRVARRERREGLLERRHERVVAATAEVVAGDAGVPHGCIGELVGQAVLPGDRRRLQVHRAPSGDVAAANACRSEREEQLAPARRLTHARRRVRVERPREEAGRLVVGRERDRLLPSAGRGLDGRGRPTPACPRRGGSGGRARWRGCRRRRRTALRARRRPGRATRTGAGCRARRRACRARACGRTCTSGRSLRWRRSCRS